MSSNFPELLQLLGQCSWIGHPCQVCWSRGFGLEKSKALGAAGTELRLAPDSRGLRGWSPARELAAWVGSGLCLDWKGNRLGAPRRENGSQSLARG